jgi:hypothetical protein
VADFTEFRPLVPVRSLIRSMARQDRPKSAIRDAVMDRVAIDGSLPDWLTPTRLTRIINQEVDRQDAVSKIEKMPKRQRTNLHSLVGCGRGETIQTRITLQWRDPTTQAMVFWGHTTTLQNQGRLMDIINAALAEAIADRIGRGYNTPTITSSMLSGDTRYRLEYVECVSR